MDLLTDLLRHAGLQRRLLDLRALDSGAALRFACDRSIGFHVVTAGTVWLHADALPEPARLQAGDIALMSRGCEHVIATTQRLPRGPIETVRARAVDGVDAAMSAPAPSAAAASTGGPAPAVVFSGAYQFWNTPVHPFFAELPPWFVLPADRQSRLSPLSLTVDLLGAEARRPAMGVETVLHGLLDVAFTYLLREIVEHVDHPQAGWCHAVQDPKVRQAVALMHEAPASDWTLDELARRVGLSRTAFATKFRGAMGDTPLNHLRTIRMQRAMHLLSERNDPLETIATEIGYQDAFSFSKVFKRTVGVAPREFRRRDAAERSVPWRF